MKSGGSLRLRLLFAAVLWSTGALAAGGAAFIGWMKTHLEESYAGRLRAYMDELSAVVRVDSKGNVLFQRPLSDPRFSIPGSGLYWQVETSAGASSSPSLQDHRFALSLQDPEVETISEVQGPAGPPVIVLMRIARTESGGSYRLVVAGRNVELDSEFGPWNTQLVAALSISATTLMLAGFVAFRKGIRTLDDLRRDLGSTRNGMKARLTGRYPAEVQPLVDDLNSLLDHSARTLDRTVSQASNLAHSLQTPLAVIANEAQRLDSTVLREQCQSMQRQVDYQLARARAVASGQSLGLRTPVRPVSDRLIRAMKTMHSSRNLLIENCIQETDCFSGDNRDLEEMIGNLIDNACKWARSRVELHSETRDNRVEIAIDDDGPGLDAKAKEAVFARGTRLDQTVPGSGLGLAIALDIATLYGGAVLLSDSPIGGLRAILKLPTP